MRNSILALCLLWVGVAHATTLEQPLADAAQEQTAREIFTELRCVVCEGQSLADSDAVLAQQMRAQVRKLLGDGESHAQVLAFFRDSYGEKILMSPPLARRTYLLWFAPLLLLLGGALAIVRATRPRHGDQV